MTPELTRRQALTLISGVIAAMTQNTTAQSKRTPDGVISLGDWNKKPSLSFDFASFTEYRFSLNGKTVVVTPEEMMAALENR